MCVPRVDKFTFFFFFYFPFFSVRLTTDIDENPAEGGIPTPPDGSLIEGPIGSPIWAVLMVTGAFVFLTNLPLGSDRVAGLLEPGS